MGLIHSRAAKKRNRAEAKVLREEAAALRAKRAAEEVATLPWWRQPTLGQAIQVLTRRNG